jgi:hypothetical protein
MSRAIKHLGWTRKKVNGCHRAERRRAGCLAKRNEQAPSKADVSELRLTNHLWSFQKLLISRVPVTP